MNHGTIDKIMLRSSCQNKNLIHHFYIFDNYNN